MEKSFVQTECHEFLKCKKNSSTPEPDTSTSEFFVQHLITLGEAGVSSFIINVIFANALG